VFAVKVTTGYEFSVQGVEKCLVVYSLKVVAGRAVDRGNSEGVCKGRDFD
jgi:hypothetical protein